MSRVSRAKFVDMLARSRARSLNGTRLPARHDVSLLGGKSAEQRPSTYSIDDKTIVTTIAGIKLIPFKGFLLFQLSS